MGPRTVADRRIADNWETAARQPEQQKGAASLRPFLVELPGIEPGSYGIPSRLLRAQSAMPLLGSPDHANKSG